MHPVVDGLYASAPEPLPFAPSLEIRAFLLRRDAGNLLVYSAPGLEASAAAIEELGGVSRHYLNHRHEAMFAAEGTTAPVLAHEHDRASAAKGYEGADAFSDRHTVDGDFEVIPTPGHTPGATTYLWDTGAHRMLFTGDTIYLDEREWVAAVLESSDRAAYIESLELLRDLDFDVLVPWAATRGQPFYEVVDPEEARGRIDAILERVRRGEES